MSKSKREELGQIVIRPPEGMRERIKAAAEANGRSMNAEIVATLEEKYPAPQLDPAEWHTLYAELLKNLAEMHDGFEQMKEAQGEYLEALMFRIDQLFERNKELRDMMDLPATLVKPATGSKG